MPQWRRKGMPLQKPERRVRGTGWSLEGTRRAMADRARQGPQRGGTVVTTREIYCQGQNQMEELAVTES
jgi:hypothetical protein